MAASGEQVRHGKAGCQPRGTETLTSSANARNFELKGGHLLVDVDEGSGERGLKVGEGPAVSAEDSGDSAGGLPLV